MRARALGFFRTASHSLPVQGSWDRPGPHHGEEGTGHQTTVRARPAEDLGAPSPASGVAFLEVILLGLVTSSVVLSVEIMDLK